MTERKLKAEVAGRDVRQIAAEHVLLRAALVKLFNATSYAENSGRREMEAFAEAREILRIIEPIAEVKP